MAEKTKLSNPEMDALKERLFIIMRDALNAAGEDCELATSFGKNTLVMNMPWVAEGLEGYFEVCLVNKTDPAFDYMWERERIGKLRAEREQKAKENAEKKAKKTAEDAKRREIKAKQKAQKAQ